MVKKRRRQLSSQPSSALLPAPASAPHGSLAPLKQDSKALLLQVVDKIRKRQIVLWTGSGFNCLSGLPTGPQLAQVIRADCTSAQQEHLASAGDYLPQVTEKYVRMRSRAELASLLRKTLTPSSPNLTLHNLVRDIKQISDVISTNYDQLFELSFGAVLGVTVRDRDIPLNRSPRRLYKVHGDLCDMDTLVITQSDYARFLTEPSQRLVWATVTTLMASKARLFMGYSLDDPNVIDLLTSVQIRLGRDCPESYLVARSVPAHEVERLSGLHVTVIQEDALAAMAFIHQGVMDHVLEDCVNDPSGGDDLLSLLRSKGASVKMTNDGLARSLSLKAPADVQFEPGALLRISDFYPDVSRDTLPLPAGSISSGVLKLDGLSISVTDMLNHDLLLTRRPWRETDGHLAVTADPTFTVPVHAKIYRAGIARVTLEHPCLRVDWILDSNDPHCDCHWQGSRDIYLSHEAFHMLEAMMDDQPLQFVQHEPPATCPLQGRLASETPKEVAKRIRALHALCDDLIKVSANYGVTLELPSSLTPEDYHALDLVLNILERKQLFTDELIVSLLRTLSGDDLDGLSGQYDMHIDSPDEQKITLLGREINLGIAHADVPNAELLNREEVERAQTSKARVVQLRIASASGRVALSYRSPGR